MSRARAVFVVRRASAPPSAFFLFLFFLPPLWSFVQLHLAIRARQGGRWPLLCRRRVRDDKGGKRKEIAPLRLMRKRERERDKKGKPHRAPPPVVHGPVRCDFSTRANLAIPSSLCGPPSPPRDAANGVSLLPREPVAFFIFLDRALFVSPWPLAFVFLGRCVFLLLLLLCGAATATKKDVIGTSRGVWLRSIACPAKTACLHGCVRTKHEKKRTRPFWQDSHPRDRKERRSRPAQVWSRQKKARKKRNATPKGPLQCTMASFFPQISASLFGGGESLA